MKGAARIAAALAPALLGACTVWIVQQASPDAGACLVYCPAGAASAAASAPPGAILEEMRARLGRRETPER